MVNFTNVARALGVTAAAAAVTIVVAPPVQAGDPHGVASISLPDKNKPPTATVVAGLKAGKYTIHGSDGITGWDEFDPNKPGFESGNIGRERPKCGVKVSYWVTNPDGVKITLEPDPETTVPC